MEDIFAPLDEEITSFERYFSENNRCILSAPFGEGKSYFLNEFIKSQTDEYDFITIYPTNYQICDNRDILEYIKRDILFGLIAFRLMRACGLYISQMRCMSLYTDLFTRKNSWNSSIKRVTGRSAESFIRYSNTSAKRSARPIVGMPSLLSISTR